MPNQSEPTLRDVRIARRQGENWRLLAQHMPTEKIDALLVELADECTVEDMEWLCAHGTGSPEILGQALAWAVDENPPVVQALLEKGAKLQLECLYDSCAEITSGFAMGFFRSSVCCLFMKQQGMERVAEEIERMMSGHVVAPAETPPQWQFWLRLLPDMDSQSVDQLEELVRQKGATQFFPVFQAKVDKEEMLEHVSNAQSTTKKKL